MMMCYGSNYIKLGSIMTTMMMCYFRNVLARTQPCSIQFLQWHNAHMKKNITCVFLDIHETFLWNKTFSKDKPTSEAVDDFLLSEMEPSISLMTSIGTSPSMRFLWGESVSLGSQGSCERFSEDFGWLEIVFIWPMNVKSKQILPKNL